MKLTLNPTDRAQDLQRTFNAFFPRLALYLFEKPHAEGEGSPKAERVHAEAELKQWIGNQSHEVELTDEMTVAQLESTLRACGLFAQVFRQSGNLWLETTRTDHWTLHRVNNENY
jgi:hypothetical protein